MTYVDTDVWTCPNPSCGATVRGTSEARRATRRACARRHGPVDEEARTAAETSPSLAVRAGLVIPKAPKGAQRGPRSRH